MGAHRCLPARRLATRCGSARVSSTWGRSVSAGGVATSTCQRASVVSGTQRAASSSRALSPRASRKASPARAVEIVATTMSARASWAERARFALLLHPHLASSKASPARTVEIVATTMCARASWAARARFALLLHPHLVWLLVRVALLRALVVRSSSVVEGALARHCIMAMIPFASCEGVDAPSRQSVRVHHALASGDERLDSATMHRYGLQFSIKLASMIHVWRQVTRAPLPCTAISC